MNKEKLFGILLSPHVTNKVYSISSNAPYVVFKVNIYATKYEIKCAVEELFEVKVNSVKTLNVKGKKRFFSRIYGNTKSWKKAYVKLYKGHDINFVGKDL